MKIFIEKCRNYLHNSIEKCNFAPERVQKDMTTLATYVKTKRKEFGLTQEDVSMKSGVGLRFVRELEQGKETLRMDKVNQVLRLFGASLEPTVTVNGYESGTGIL